jgi:putative acetyltransferase
LNKKVQIILIGGVGGTGKTLLASKLMQRINAPYYSIDHLMMGLYRGLESCPFEPLDSSEKISLTMWPIVKSMVKTNIENQHSVIFEGFQLQPRDVSALFLEFPGDITPVFIGFSERYLRNQGEQNIKAYRNTVEQRFDETFDLKAMLAEHTRMKNECERLSLPFIEIDVDYERSMSFIVNELESKVQNAFNLQG